MCHHSYPQMFSGQYRPGCTSLGANNSITVEKEKITLINVNFKKRDILFLIPCVLKITEQPANNPYGYQVVSSLVGV